MFKKLERWYLKRRWKQIFTSMYVAFKELVGRHLVLAKPPPKGGGQNTASNKKNPTSVMHNYGKRRK